MKHLITLCLCLMLLSSCNVTVPQPEFPLLPYGTVSVFCNGIQYKGKIEIGNNAVMVIFLQSPSELNGTNLMFTDKELKVTVDGISLNYSTEDIDNSPFVMLNDVLNQLNLQKPEFIVNNNLLCAQITCNKGECKVICTKDDKRLKEIHYDNLIFLFSEVP